MKIIGCFEERIVAPQCSDGTDWGCKGFVLFQFGKKRLIWRGSGSCWSGIGMPRGTFKSTLTALGVKDKFREFGHIEIAEGGRLSKGRLIDLVPKIREAMGLDWIGMAYLDPKKTFVVERVER